jgi:cytochrome P450
MGARPTTASSCTTWCCFHDPSDIREVLIDKAASFGKDRTQKRMKILLGEGLITSDGEAHKRGRRIAAPAFIASAFSATRADCRAGRGRERGMGSRRSPWTLRKR